MGRLEYIILEYVALGDSLISPKYLFTSIKYLTDTNLLWNQRGKCESSFQTAISILKEYNFFILSNYTSIKKENKNFSPLSYL